ncbi:MAG: TetR/AcrR family transcriptional regulator [Proteobacteria bacterium]|nr:TetR/AcrR family transcriptional regulator [Pseudomonadota bacterium]
MDPEVNQALGDVPPDGEERPRSEKRREREAAIVAAAIEEFQVAGLMNARLDDIAARAGVAKGTLYLYFDGKEDLFKAAVRSLIHPIFVRMEQQVANFQGSSEDLLRQAIRQMYADVARERPGRELMRLMISEGHRMPELAAFYYEEIAARGLAMVRMIIWRGIAQGEFRQSPAAEFPHLVFAPCKMLATWQLMFGERYAIDAERFAEAHADFVIAALRAPPPADGISR